MAAMIDNLTVNGLGVGGMASLLKPGHQWRTDGGNVDIHINCLGCVIALFMLKYPPPPQPPPFETS